MPTPEREQVEDWTEGWSKRGLPMRGWQGPESLLQNLAEAVKCNCLHAWPAGSLREMSRDTSKAEPLDIEDICPFWWQAEEELDDDGMFEAIRVVRAFLEQGACGSNALGVCCAWKRKFTEAR